MDQRENNTPSKENLYMHPHKNDTEKVMRRPVYEGYPPKDLTTQEI